MKGVNQRDLKELNCYLEELNKYMERCKEKEIKAETYRDDTVSTLEKTKQHELDYIKTLQAQIDVIQFLPRLVDEKAKEVKKQKRQGTILAVIGTLITAGVNLPFAIQNSSIAFLIPTVIVFVSAYFVGNQLRINNVNAAYDPLFREAEEILGDSPYENTESMVQEKKRMIEEKEQHVKQLDESIKRVCDTFEVSQQKYSELQDYIARVWYDIDEYKETLIMNCKYGTVFVSEDCKRLIKNAMTRVRKKIVVEGMYGEYY